MNQQRNELAIDASEDIKKDLDYGQMQSAEATAEEKRLEDLASEHVAKLTEFDIDDHDRQEDIKFAVESMALEVQKKAAKQSAMLQQPLNTIKHRSEDGGDVAKALIDLKVQVEDLDPARFDFDEGALSRILGYLPGIGGPIKRYFSKYESAQTVIAAIIKSIELGRGMLERDNITLKEDQVRMRDMTKKLDKAIILGQKIDNKLVYKLERELGPDDPRRKFIEEEILFSLRQRIQDLQQQLAVNQQGVLAMEIVIRNNKELIRGVNRALNVTVSALQTAVTVALALNNQKIVLDKVNALSKTTDNLIANTAKRLKTQGAEIHKQASSTALNMETLKGAFADINAALDDISSFRSKALPQMAQNILEMNDLTKDAEDKIQRMEKGNRNKPNLTIDAEV
ncbi:MAG: toxic anion resistance protein [Pseudobacteriovorax sp.]|nr:toxic anion resistance protein [Pseudobacteriovorax sp.]